MVARDRRGLAGDVVDGRLRRAVTGQAGQGGVHDPDPLGGGDFGVGDRRLPGLLAVQPDHPEERRLRLAR